MSVLGFGTCCLDYLATVDSFPEPDSKIRTTSALITGGGNAANSMATVARLGISAGLVCKVGTDQIGDQLVAGMAAEGCNIKDPRYLSFQ